jgi:putative endonuclease
MKLRTFFLGRAAERRARRYLRKCGYRLLASNVRAGPGEIDMLAVDGHCLVAVEVKRRSAGFLQADQSVHAHKLELIESTFIAFLHKNPTLKGLNRRVDLILIDGQHRISHHVGVG